MLVKVSPASRARYTLYGSSCSVHAAPKRPPGREARQLHDQLRRQSLAISEHLQVRLHEERLRVDGVLRRGLTVAEQPAAHRRQAHRPRAFRRLAGLHQLQRVGDAQEKPSDAGGTGRRLLLAPGRYPVLLTVAAGVPIRMALQDPRLDRLRQRPCAVGKAARTSRESSYAAGYGLPPAPSGSHPRAGFQASTRGSAASSSPSNARAW